MAKNDFIFINGSMIRKNKISSAEPVHVVDKELEIDFWGVKINLDITNSPEMSIYFSPRGNYPDTKEKVDIFMKKLFEELTKE